MAPRPRSRCRRSRPAVDLAVAQLVRDGPCEPGPTAEQHQVPWPGHERYWHLRVHRRYGFKINFARSSSPFSTAAMTWSASSAGHLARGGHVVVRDPPVVAAAVSLDGDPAAVVQAAEPLPGLRREADQPADADPSRQPVHHHDHGRAVGSRLGRSRPGAAPRARPPRRPSPRSPTAGRPRRAGRLARAPASTRRAHRRWSGPPRSRRGSPAAVRRSCTRSPVTSARAAAVCVARVRSLEHDGGRRQFGQHPAACSACARPRSSSAMSA